MVFSTKFVIDQTDPLLLAFLRFGIGAVCLAPILLKSERPCIFPGDLSTIVWLGMLMYAAMPALVCIGLQFTPASRGALILASQPLLTLLLARWRREERFTLAKLFGTALAASGLVIALGEGVSLTSNIHFVWVGDVLLLCAAGCVSGYNVYSQPYLQRYPALLFTTLTMVVGALTLAPIAMGVSVLQGLPTFTPLGWSAVLYIGTLGGGIGYALWVWALERTSPTRVAVCLTLNPLTATLLGAVLLHEPVTLRFVVGLLAVLIGIVVTNIPETDQTPRSAPI